MTTDDKFKRFLAMTDRPEDFSDEELMELRRDPEMAAWYAALSDAERVIKTRSPRKTKWVFMLLATAAVLTVVFFLWPDAAREEPPALTTHEMPELQKDEKVARPMTVQQTDQEHLLAVTKKAEPVAHKGDTEPLGEKIASLTIVPTSADLGPGVTMRLGEHCPMIAEAESPAEKQQPVIAIPSDRQTLADIYLAEVALQVAYEQQAQAQALRAYAASLEDEEEETPAQPIIAF
jgi:hypothetical protein